MLQFSYKSFNHKEETLRQRTDRILERADERNRYYKLLIMLVESCMERNIRLIIENPYHGIQYLNHNFLIEPSYIDNDRSRRGDYFVKPTMYYFVNCEPTNGFTWQKDKTLKNVKSMHGHEGNLCDEERSMISPDYARNFICDNILGITQEVKLNQLFLF
jgi:hypothetical protein